MGEAYEEFRAAGADVIAVFQYRAEPTYNFARKRDVPFDCLGDPEREAYHAVGLERGPAREYIGPQLVRASCGRRAPGPVRGNSEGTSRSGRALSSCRPRGQVLYAHYNQDSADNPPIEELLDVVRDYVPRES